MFIPDALIYSEKYPTLGDMKSTMYDDVVDK